jgi:adenylate kinase
MDEKLNYIKEWLGTGSINIFGLPFSGKDTVGVKLAELLNARFLSSGMILRAATEVDMELRHDMAGGLLAPTDKFKEIILPYLGREDLRDFPLILSSVGRWEGEEVDVMAAAEKAGHKIKLALLLNISENEVWARWQNAQVSGDRGLREDDKVHSAIETRIDEFVKKTMPVIDHYHAEGLMLSVIAMGTREEVFENVVNNIYHYAREHSN